MGRSDQYNLRIRHGAANETPMHAITLGIDIGKRWLHVVGLDTRSGISYATRVLLVAETVSDILNDATNVMTHRFLHRSGC
jgi:hypothetical protein